MPINCPDEVREHSSQVLSLDFEFWDIGDPAGAQRSQSDMKTCFQILHSKNIMIEPGIQTLQIRLESVRKPLRTLIDGRPQFVLHNRCAELRRGLQGGYHYRRLAYHRRKVYGAARKEPVEPPMRRAGIWLPRGCLGLASLSGSIGPRLMSKRQGAARQSPDISHAKILHAAAALPRSRQRAPLRRLGKNQGGFLRGHKRFRL